MTMQTSTTDHTPSSEPGVKSFTLTKAILWATVIAGVLDATDGVVFFGLHGLNPIQVLQYIASGILGASSFQGGLFTAALGTVIHFLIAAVVASIYIVVSRRLSFVNRYVIALGLSYGAAVYLFMTYVVLPVSAVAPSAFSLAALLNGLIGHALFVGLPIALVARKVAA
jgi:uncharacterized membrane protein YagU involved in acid resistance